MGQSGGRITQEMVEAARHAFHGAVERQVPGSWSYQMRFDGAMFFALEAALKDYTLIPNNAREGEPVLTVED